MELDRSEINRGQRQIWIQILVGRWRVRNTQIIQIERQTDRQTERWMDGEQEIDRWRIRDRQMNQMEKEGGRDREIDRQIKQIERLSRQLDSQIAR